MNQFLIQLSKCITYEQFRQAVRANEGQSSKSLKQFWKEFDIYEAIKTSMQPGEKLHLP
jgi:hypothetical protein